MPRSTTPKEKYIAEIESMLKSWVWLDEITANKLQKLVGGKYSKISEMLEEYKIDYIEKMNEKNKAPQPIWYQDIVWNITESITQNLWNSWLIINNEINTAIKKDTDDFEVQRNIFESQKLDDSKQIKNLELEIDELKTQLTEKDSSIAHLKKTLTITLSDTDRLKAEAEKLKTENSNLIKSIWVLEWKMQMKDEIIKKLEKK